MKQEAPRIGTQGMQTLASSHTDAKCTKKADAYALVRATDVDV